MFYTIFFILNVNRLKSSHYVYWIYINFFILLLIYDINNDTITNVSINLTTSTDDNGDNKVYQTSQQKTSISLQYKYQSITSSWCRKDKLLRE